MTSEPGIALAERAVSHAPVSEVISRVALDWPTDRVSLGDMIEAFGLRSYGLLIVLFAIPNLLPVYIPGLSPIFGIPLCIICAQLALGYDTPRMPGFLTRRTMRRSDLQMIALKAQPWLRRVERFVRPRPSVVTGRVSERVIGFYGMLLALIVIVPLPLTNGPPSLACAIMAIGLMEEDTATILGGAAFGVAAILLSLSIMGGLWWAVAQALGFVFGA